MEEVEEEVEVKEEVVSHHQLLTDVGGHLQTSLLVFDDFLLPQC